MKLIYKQAGTFLIPVYSPVIARAYRGVPLWVVNENKLSDCNYIRVSVRNDNMKNVLFYLHTAEKICTICICKEIFRRVEKK